MYAVTISNTLFEKQNMPRTFLCSSYDEVQKLAESTREMAADPKNYREVAGNHWVKPENFAGRQGQIHVIVSGVFDSSTQAYGGDNIMPSIFAQEWRDCLRAHYLHVVRSADRATEESLHPIMIKAGFTENQLKELYIQATAHVEDENHGPKA